MLSPVCVLSPSLLVSFIEVLVFFFYSKEYHKYERCFSILIYPRFLSRLFDDSPLGAIVWWINYLSINLLVIDATTKRNRHRSCLLHAIRRRDFPRELHVRAPFRPIQRRRRITIARNIGFPSRLNCLANLEI